VEVGHSERRRDHGEVDERVALKVVQILRHQMTPIVCVGEPTPRPIDEALEFVLRQLQGGLATVRPSDRNRIVVAYEPVWAIGIGAHPASPEFVSAMFDGIHRWLRSPGDGGVDSRVIYGGSVDEATAGPLLGGDGVDGLFIGRAALDPERFAAIAGIAQDRLQ
jgi:triosephosphate isomerase